MIEIPTPPQGLPYTPLAPTYALRVWLTALLSQAIQIETQIRYRIEDLEKEAARLREQRERTGPVIESLRQSIHSTDEALRRQREMVDAVREAQSAAVARPETPAAAPGTPEPPRAEEKRHGKRDRR